MREPARIAELVRLLMLTLVAFGVAITDSQINALVELVAALAVLAASWGLTEWLRRRVTPVEAPRLEEGSRVTVTREGEPSHTATVR